MLGVHEPRVGLLSNGHEEGKGNRLVIDSYRLLADDDRLLFAGNIEGRDVPLGAVDVVVTDGFTGNVVLKLLEGTGAWLFDEIRQAATSSWQGKLGGLLLRPKLRPLRDKVNPDTYGGSYLIGLRAIAVKAHGDSGPVAISNALRHAARGVREGLIEDIARRVHPEPPGPTPRRSGEQRHAGFTCIGGPRAIATHGCACYARPAAHRSTHGGTLATREEVLDQVKQILVQQLGVDEGQVTPEASFQDDLDADSLDLVELIMELEDQFGVKIPDEEAQGIKTVNQAVDYIMENAS